MEEYLEVEDCDEEYYMGKIKEFELLIKRFPGIEFYKGKLRAFQKELENCQKEKGQRDN